MARTQRKTQTDTKPFNMASISVLEGSGERGAMRRPFSAEAGVAAFESWVYAAASINAQAVASVPLRLYVRKRAGAKCLFSTRPVGRRRKAYLVGDGAHQPHATTMRKAMQMGDFEEVTESHPLLDLLGNVNPYLNGFDFTTLRILWGELTGNAYCLLIQGDGASNPPTELWPLPPQWTWIIPSRSKWVAGYLYGKNPTERKTFAPDEVIHFKRPNPRDQFYGLGKVEGGWSTVMLNQANHTMDRALSENMGRPDYLVIAKAAQADQLDRLDAKIKSNLRGKMKSGKWLSVSGEVDIKPLQWPPKDLAGREDVVEEIAAVFGVPVSMMKANDPNLAAAKAGYGLWREGTILPLCRMDEQTLNQSLVPLYDDNLLLAYDNPVPADEASEREDTKTLVGGGIISANERRMEIGYGEAPGEPMADKLLINGIPLGGAAPAMQFNLTQGAEEAAPPVEEETAPPSGNVETTQASVLNGAQITAATAIVVSVAAGEIPRDAGLGQLEVLFNLSPEQAERIMGSAGTSTPTTPNPNPNAETNNGNASNSGTGDRGSVGGNDDSGSDPALQEDRKGHPSAAGLSGSDSGRERAGADGSKTDTTKQCPASADAVQDAIGANASISAKALVNGEPLCCLHHKGDADDTARDLERESPIKIFASRVQDIFTREREAVARAIEAAPVKATKAVSDVTDAADAALDSFNDEMTKVMREALDQFTQQGGDAGLAKVRSKKPKAPKPGAPAPNLDTFNVRDPNVAKHLDAYAVKLTKEVQGYTGEKISKTIKDAMAEGASTADIARNLREDASAAGGSLSPARSETISRTESARAYTNGQEESWKQSGVVEGKKWMLAAEACPFCEAAAAQFNDKTLALGDSFFAKGSTLTADVDGKPRVMTFDYSSIEGPPLHPMCRCDVEPVLIGE